MRKLGYLAGVNSFVPKATMRSRFSGTLGALGKGAFIPPPLPPGASPKSVLIRSAYNKKTKDYYYQDPRCEEGDRTWKCKDKIINHPSGCKFNECCGILFASGSPWGPICFTNPEDCDHPDTPTECDTDVDYVEFPDKEWTSCQEVKAAFKKAGIPAKFVQQVCDEEDFGVPGKAPPAGAPAGCPAGQVKREGKCVYPPCPKGQTRKGAKCEWPPCPEGYKREGPKCLPPCKQAPCTRPPPQHAKCRVPGYGYKNLICKTAGHGTNCRTDWVCPTGKDVRMGRGPGTWGARPKPKPKAKSAPKVKAEAKTLKGYFGEAKANNMFVYGLGALLLFSIVKSAK